MAEETNYGFSYEYGLDINVSETETPEWQSVRFISNLDPKVEPKEQDAATYDDKGAEHPVKLGENWSISFWVQQQRSPLDGSYLPEIEFLLKATKPDATGVKAVVPIRWYDKPAKGKPNPNDAFEGVATVTMNRAETGNDAIAGWNVELKGQGRRKAIANPFKQPGSGGGSSSGGGA